MCLQCGYVITDTTVAPSGFCSDACAEVYAAIFTAECSRFQGDQKAA